MAKTKRKKPTPKKGLGDMVEDLTKATGIKKIVGDCKPCEERKEKLNNFGEKVTELFRRFKPKPMTEEQRNDWETFKSRENQEQINPEEQKLIIKLLKDVLNTSVAPCNNCNGSAWNKYIDRIDMVYCNEDEIET